ncbi:type I restriction enzyme S subunit [Ereboglobus sp. PH5-10]|uniref:restriction endonuclease subunit S n=1 Tax=Ereboglobus sp. PH5-10 TaxID=2940629 RepID=UPI002405B308|nr:restriction endonuclease subunit S [Ereboglobus sp. PH5-10]MDF9827938.1 type I restriction enzyme S subunit [Ereboglobus sp. PH5-10]
MKPRTQPSEAKAPRPRQTAASEWKDATLGDFISLQRGHDLTDPERRAGNIPVMGSAGQNGFHDTALAKGPGIVIGRSGASFGQVHYSDVDYWPHNTALYVTDFKGNDVRFAYYLLKTLDFSGYNSGSAQPSLNRNYIYLASVKIPPLPEQRAIADMLGILDDKIDLLHRQNKTLESLAETLFRQTFIESPQPDWKEGKLGDVTDNIRESIKTEDILAETKYIGLEHIDKRNIALNQYGHGDAVSSNKSAFGKNDILFGKLRPYFHKVVIAPFSGICSTDILVLRPKRPEYLAFCLFAFFQDDVVAYANLGSGGTRMPRTDWNTLSQYEIVIPDTKAINAFNAFAIPALEKIQKNIAQIKTLEAIRNMLLPRLMGGESKISTI